MSTLTWLDFSDAERRRALQVVELLGRPETRDELGLGAIRDAFANALFPITVEQVMTDNGSPHRSTLRAIACRTRRLSSAHPRPPPPTNGKAGRFIRTMLAGWTPARSTAPTENAPPP
jgi:hypothetical protein